MMQLFPGQPRFPVAVSGMIHYHGTPVGGTRQDAIRFLRGRHALVSFAHPEDIGAVADVCQSFILDNGAFSVWKSGGKLDIPGYISWVKEWRHHPGFDWAIIPDVIEGTAVENGQLIENWCNMGLRSIGAPVWHMHEEVRHLQRYCQCFRHVCLGSSGQWASPGTESWWRRMGEAMRGVCDPEGKPMTRLHGLRMMDPQIFSRLPLSSADSTNAAVNGGSLKRFGNYVPPTSSQRSAVIAERIEAHNSSAIWVGAPEPEMLLFN